jgi:uncharacterized phage protein (TIGR01671 family)
MFQPTDDNSLPNIMKKENKFRVWDHVDYMSRPFSFYDLIVKKIEFTVSCTVMQFIGLQDKNGTDIYELEIAKYFNRIGVIVYNTDKAAFCLYTKKDNYYVQLDKSVVKDLKILGNIFQNSDLIK